MKTNWLIFILVILTKEGITQQTIVPLRILVSCNKTTNLIFPYDIRSADCGSRDVLLQKADGEDRVLQIKASRPDFPETNLTVLTSASSFYSLLLKFDPNPNPVSINVLMGSGTEIHGPIETNEAALDSIGMSLLHRQGRFHVSSRGGPITLILQDIRLDHNLLWMALHEKSGAFQGFDLKTIRFIRIYKHRPKRTAEQEKDIIPIYVSSKDSMLGDGESLFILAFHHIWIPRGQKLECMLARKDVDEFVMIKIPRRLIMQAYRINHSFE
jgi:hypothetical protein